MGNCRIKLAFLVCNAGLIGLVCALILWSIPLITFSLVILVLSFLIAGIRWEKLFMRESN